MQWWFNLGHEKVYPGHGKSWQECERKAFTFSIIDQFALASSSVIECPHKTLSVNKECLPLTQYNQEYTNGCLPGCLCLNLICALVAYSTKAVEKRGELSIICTQCQLCAPSTCRESTLDNFYEMSKQVKKPVLLLFFASGHFSLDLAEAACLQCSLDHRHLCTPRNIEGALIYELLIEFKN